MVYMDNEFSNVAKNLKEKNIEDIASINESFRRGISDLFNMFLPSYRNEYGQIKPEDFFIKCKRQNIIKMEESRKDGGAKFFHNVYVLIDELNDMGIDWKNCSNVNQLMEIIASKWSDRYINEPHYCTSFEEAVINTINANIDRNIKFKNQEDMIKKLIISLKSYFYDDNFAVFTRKFNSREYVMRNAKAEILDEMISTCKFDTSLTGKERTDAVICSYASNIAIKCALADRKLDNSDNVENEIANFVDEYESQKKTY